MRYRRLRAPVKLLMLTASLEVGVVAHLQSRPSNPMELAVALADARMPAGMILPDAALEPYRSTLQTRRATADVLNSQIVAATAGFPTPLAAERRGGVWLIQDPSAPADVVDQLHRLRSRPRPTMVSAADAIFIEIVALLREEKGTGVLGSGRQPDERCPLQQSVDLDGGQVSVVGLLNQTVEQVPGVVWFVTYDSVLSAMALGIVCPGGQYFKMTVK